MMPANPAQCLVDEAIIETLEFVIAKCHEQRLSIGANLDYRYIEEIKIRQDGFRGALAWVEDQCSEQISQLRGVLK